MIAEPLPLLAALAALLVIVLTAVAASEGLVPTYGEGSPLAILWLLLLVDLRSILGVGGPTLGPFVIGAAGMFAGAIIADRAVGGPDALDPLHHAVSGMYVGTYVEGSVNFNTIALACGVVDDPAIHASAAAVDDAMTAL